MKKRTPLGPYRRPLPRVLGGSYGGGRFLMSEVLLYVYKFAIPPGAGAGSGTRAGAGFEDSEDVGAIGLALEPLV